MKGNKGQEYLGSMLGFGVAFVLVASCGASLGAINDQWSLPGAGETNGVQSGPWQGTTLGASTGNPYSDNNGGHDVHAANWYAMFQRGSATYGDTSGLNPSLTDSFQPMVLGTLYSTNNYRAWTGGSDVIAPADPYPRYGGFELGTPKITSTTVSTVRNGEGSALLWQAPDSGRFQVDITGLLTTYDTPTLGYTKVTIYTMNADRTSADNVQSYKLNLAGGFHDPADSAYSNQLTYSQSLDLQAGQFLVLRFQSYAASPNASGVARLNFDPAKGNEFEIRQVAIPEPSLLPLLGLGGWLLVRRRGGK